MSQSDVKLEFAPHLDLYSGWHFIKILENGDILGVKLTIIETQKIMGPDGKQKINPDGSRIYNINTNTVSRIFSFDDYKKAISSYFNEPK